jgi:hypothetical protein
MDVVSSLFCLVLIELATWRLCKLNCCDRVMWWVSPNIVVGIIFVLPGQVVINLAVLADLAGLIDKVNLAVLIKLIKLIRLILLMTYCYVFLGWFYCIWLYSVMGMLLWSFADDFHAAGVIDSYLLAAFIVWLFGGRVVGIGLLYEFE